MNFTADDRWQIQSLLTRYSYGLDFGDKEVFLSCFSPDAVFEVVGVAADAGGADYVRTGHEELGAFLDEIHEGLRGHSRHWVLNVLLDRVDEHAATAVSYCHIVRPGEFPRVGTTLTGLYRDRLVRTDAGWLLQHRVFIADPQPEHGRPSTDVLVTRFDARLG